ncbi:MAG: S9 family peptidase [Dehalococcoidales bacterium]|nr:S9 family peptidase [Dehalococcoidales bacterium]
MTEKKVAGYGSWKSPVTSDLVSSSAIRLDSQVVIDGDNIYWVEMRPSEGGRYVLVRRKPDGAVNDINPAPYNARTRVHEYGGGAYIIAGDTVYFSNFSDQRLYRQDSGSEPVPVTPENSMRYADGVIDRKRNRIICVCEDHSKDDREAENCIAAVDIATGKVTGLVTGNDFYSSPRISPDGTQLAWLAWNHPNMPWDCTELWTADIAEDGSLSNRKHIAGTVDEAIAQPEYSPGGILYFVWEKTGWLNLYRWNNGQAEPLCRMEAEFSSPHWVFGQSAYSFESEKRIICSYEQGGESYLVTLDTETLELNKIDIPYSVIGTVKAVPGYAVLLAGSPSSPSAIVRLDLSSGETEVLKQASDVVIDPGYISIPESIEFPTENSLTAHAIYYRPVNAGYTAPEGERPPLMVISHGGPTSATSSSLSLSIQHWTSRGFAVADVNYGGSTGYGREYRQRLDGNWGIVDVDDCVNCARYLIERGEVDGKRTAIRGGSAGGYTTLASLAFRDTFRAGASYYGVSDLEALETDTHKFESRYLDRIVGPYPERRDLFISRSPIHSVESLSCPVIFFQGDEDKIVPPDQAELMADALRKKGIPVAYILFEGEQHGFRKAENIKRALDAELYFYGKIFGFEPADEIEPVQIDNLG